jgi:transposase
VWRGGICPDSFGPWQTIWKRHKRFSTDGTWDKIHARLVAEADADGRVECNVSVDSTINRAHQHATTLSRVEAPAGRRTGG